MKPNRTVEVLIAGLWSIIPFNELREGDIFRLFEEDGSMVDAGVIYEAESNTYINKDNILTVKNRLGGRILHEKRY